MTRNRVIVAIAFMMMLAFGVEAQKPKPKKPVKKAPVEKTKTPVKQTTQKPKAPAKTTGTPASQKPADKQAFNPDAAQDEKKVRDMIAFLEYMLNTLGSTETSSRDKDVLVTESYSKIFRDSKVQVEDDLDEDRLVITNKDIIAYLKDVDFFFNEVRFEFAIDGVQTSTLADGTTFYKVSTTRNMKGTSQEGVGVNNTSRRYIEINYSAKDQDLKIVSIYTNQLDEKGALINWWAQLSYEWRTLFKQKLNITDSADINSIKRVIAIDELDLRGNESIQNIEPLAELENLKKLNLSGTATSDISPIRNLTGLTELDISNTKVKDLTPLKYSNQLVRINISNTPVIDISVIAKMPVLKQLELENTQTFDFTPVSVLTELQLLNAKGTKIADLIPLENLSQLTNLNLSNTPITGLNSLKGLRSLTELAIDSTHINGLTALISLESLKILHANYTMISDLKPLQKLGHLEKVYCDQTPINREAADAFMSSNPRVLVVFDSKDLKVWWETLPDQWKEVLGSAAKTGLSPAKDELARVTNIDSLNFSGNTFITDLEPLRKLRKLRAVVAGKTGIRDLSPLKEHRDIRYLDVSETAVDDLSPVAQFSKLHEIRADGSKIQSIEPLHALAMLKKVYVDHTAIQDINAQDFLEKNPRCLLVYKTVHLNRWWSGLSENWKEVFRAQWAPDTTKTRENLHKLVEQESLHFKDVQVTDLSALGEFVRLRDLQFSGTLVTDISSPPAIKTLRSLYATNSPIQKIESIALFTELEDLDISNTPVDDLRPIGVLHNLKKLNCSGTQIKRLDAVETLQALEFVDCSNTFVGKLDPLVHLPLKTLKCYNTKIPTRRVDDFKASKPDCNVMYYR